MPAEDEIVIGYGVFETFEECYQYSENECFIADSIPNAERFMEAGFTDVADCRIDAIRFADIMSDYGALGSYLTFHLLLRRSVPNWMPL